MKTFKLIISSPVGNLFDVDVCQLDVRGVEGELAVMAGHIPFVTALKAAPCHIHFPDGTIKDGTLKGGLLSVGNEQTTLIASSFKFTE